MKMNDSEIVLSNLYRAYESVRDYEFASFLKTSSYSSIINRDSGWPNFVFNISSEELNFEKNLNEITDNIKEGKVPPYLVFDNEQLTSTVLDNLAANNFINVEQWAGMSLKLSGKFNADSEKYLVKDKVDLIQWQNFVSNVLFTAKGLSTEFCEYLMGRKDIRLLQLKEENKTVASAMLFLEGATSGLFMVATHPDYRKKGLGVEITKATISLSAASGCSNVVLQSTKMGLPLYQKCGFESCNNISIFWLADKKFR